MTVKVKSVAAAEAPAADAVPSMVRIRLTGFKRYATGGALFESDQTYEVEAERAKKLLAIREEGLAPFSIYSPPVEKVIEKVVAEAPVKPAPVAFVPPSPKIESSVKVEAKDAKISLTTPEEEAELGLPPEDAVTV